MITGTGRREFVKFRGIKVNNVDYGDAYGIIRDTVEKKGKGYVCMTDVGNVMAATQDDGLKEAINSSLLSLADGAPLAWYAKLLGCREIERISGADLLISMLSEKNGLKHLLLGDTEQRINRVMEKAESLNHTVRIAGYSPPFKDFDDEDNRLIMETIRSEDPDVIWVSFGGGKQEKWMRQNLAGLERGVMIGVGAAFKWMIGELKMPPKIIQRLGLQWSYRITQALIRDPGKYAKMIVTKVLKRKIQFLWHFPGEVLRTRREYRKKPPERLTEV